MLKGVLIKESLEDESVLNELLVTGTKVVNIDKPAKGQSPVWTLIYFDVMEEQRSAVAEKLSEALRPGKWYVDFKSEKEACVVFAGKIFHYQRGDAAGQQAAAEYGRSLGIPESQLDW